jgi:biotin synthase
MDKQEIINWLTEQNTNKLEQLFVEADKVRKEHVGDEVHLRGLIEVSNHCRRGCTYCGISVSNSSLTRYRMTKAEILECAHKAVALQYGTVVLQAGEDMALDREFITDIIRSIKGETSLAVTLSLGEREEDELIEWKNAGADRYLLRFETSDAALFASIHPPAPGRKPINRMDLLKKLSSLGYEAGSGVMAGIPGQTYASLADDILAFQNLDLDMIGIGPYIPHPLTPLGSLKASNDPNQAPNTEEMVYKMIALTRIHCPESNIPSTTALATLNKAKGRELGLQRGANIVMPNLTPVDYRQYYEIYPSKACIFETAEECHGCLNGRIRSIGRTAGKGHGGRKKVKIT